MSKTISFNQNKWDLRFLDMAKLVASWSKDPSTQTGAVIVRPNKTVVSVGFNGFPMGMPDTPEMYSNRDEKYSRIVHSEMNAVLFSREPLDGCTLYTWPFLSCDRCCVHMLQAGIDRFVAPRCLDEAKLARWKDAFNRTTKYCSEAGADITLI